MNVLVIGSGPSAIIALQKLKNLERIENITCYSIDDEIGGTFYNKRYEDSNLVSSKYITAFSDFRFTKNAYEHPTLLQYLDYLKEYCTLNDLYKFITFKHEVLDVIPIMGSNFKKFKVKIKNIDSNKVFFDNLVYDYIIVSSGLHNTPFYPEIKNQKEFKGEILHSINYKEKKTFKDKKVLIVGVGETGMDLANHAINNAKEVSMLIRRGFLSVPTEIPVGNDKILALDTMITNLFECTYVHPMCEWLQLKWKVTTWFIRIGFLLASGTSKGFNQYVGTLPDVKRGAYIINKQVSSMPYLNYNKKQKSFIGKYLYGFWDDNPEKKSITVYDKTTIKEIVNDYTVKFTNGQSNQFDLILLATGYLAEFSFLRQNFELDNQLPNERNIVYTKYPHLCFLGIVRPNVGAIPPMAELQMEWYIERILRNGKNNLIHYYAKLHPLYFLIGENKRTHKYAVDYGLYMHQIARDFGAAPDLFSLLSSFKFKIFISYTFGQSYATFFHLFGPFKNSLSYQVSENELFDTVTQRSFSMNFVFLLNFIAFGIINLCFWILDCFMLGLLTKFSHYYS